MAEVVDNRPMTSCILRRLRLAVILAVAAMADASAQTPSITVRPDGRLDVSAPPAEAVMRYTLDGTDPTRDAGEWLAPVARAARLHREGAGGCRGRHARGRGRDVERAARRPAHAVDARAGDAEPRLARLRLDDAPPRGVSADAGAPAGHRHARRFDHALLGRRAGRRPPHRRRGVGPLLRRPHRRQSRLRVGSHGERALAPGERRVRGRDAEGGGADDRHQQHHAQHARRDCRRRRRPSARRFTSGRRRRRFCCSPSSRADSSPTPRAARSTR